MKKLLKKALMTLAVCFAALIFVQPAFAADLDEIVQSPLVMEDITKGADDTDFALGSVLEEDSNKRNVIIEAKQQQLAVQEQEAANFVAEAEKYLGDPYVWGAASPGGFDCSGLICWCINNCGNGWSVPRTNAEGLRSYCEVVSEDDLKVGDLVFFQGTYATNGASHVGIYVGDGQMLNASGSCVKYSDLDSSFWTSHFLEYGRLTF